MEEAFGAPVRNTYSASKFPRMAYDWAHGWLPAEQLSDTVLLTNLANRVQPLIRYDLGDRVLVSPDPCPCGSPLPAMRVEGRTNDVLVLSSGPATVRLLPLSLVTVVEDVLGVRRCQLVQTEAVVLRVRIEVAPSADSDTVWAQVLRGLRDHVAGQGARDVRIERAPEEPGVEGRRGKLRQVIVLPGVLPSSPR